MCSLDISLIALIWVMYQDSWTDNAPWNPRWKQQFCQPSIFRTPHACSAELFCEASFTCRHIVVFSDNPSTNVLVQFCYLCRIHSQEGDLTKMSFFNFLPTSRFSLLHLEQKQEEEGGASPPPTNKVLLLYKGQTCRFYAHLCSLSLSNSWWWTMKSKMSMVISTLKV